MILLKRSNTPPAKMICFKTSEKTKVIIWVQKIFEKPENGFIEIKKVRVSKSKSK